MSRYHNVGNCTDNDFGPVVRNCRDGFDLTILFEETILSATPSIIMMVLAAGRVFYLRKKPKLVWARGFQLFKLVRYKKLF